MSNKKNDQNFISELLGKLKASYSAPEEQNDLSSKKDTSDAEFQKQLREMLKKAPAEKPKQKEKKEPAPKKASPTQAQDSKKSVISKKAPQKSVSKKAIEAKEAPNPPVEITVALPEEPVAQELSVEKSIPVIAEMKATEQENKIEEEPLPEPVINEVKKSAPLAQEQPPIKEQASPKAVKKTEPLLSEKEEKAPVSDTIVIRPKQASSRRQESIVIRPRAQSKTIPTPVRIETEIPNTPIKIGRKEDEPPMKTSTIAKPSSAVEKEREPQRNEKSSVVSSKATEQNASSDVAPSSTSQTESAVKNASAEVNAEIIVKNEEPAREESPLFQEEPKNASQAAPKNSQPASELSFSEQIHQKSGLSEEDLSLLFELGYDSELANLVGVENLKKLKSENLRKKNRHQEASYPTAFGYRGKEYTGAEDQSGILAAYIHDRKYLIARLILTALCTLCLLFIDVPTLQGARWIQISQALPWLFPIVGILLLIASAALSAKQLLAGAKALFEFAPTPYSVCGILLIPTLIYDILAMLHPAVNLPVNFPVALVFLAGALCDVFRLWGELRVFRLLSQSGEKNVLESITLRKKKMKYGDKTVKILNDDIGERFYRIAKAKETSGFFRRFNTATGTSKSFSLLILTAFFLSLLLALAVAIKTLSFSAAANTFISLLILCTPLSAVFGAFYPLFHSNRILTRHQCALIGAESVEEYNLSKTLVLEDGDMFHTEKCTEIALDESGDFQNDMRLASALFRTVGSTLEHLGQAALGVDDIPVSLLRILENGVEATAGERHLLAGDASFLKRYGIRVPKESSDRAMRRTENVSVMYVAIDGTLKLNYEIEYTEKFTFEKIAEALLESKTAIAIRSYDPNLNNTFVQQLRDGKKEPLRVIKPARYEENSVLDLVDTGAISLDSPEKTVCALHAAAKVEKVQSFTVRLQLIATLLGGIGALLLALLEGEFLGIASIALYHLFWIAVSIAATHIEINEEKLHLLK